MHIWCFQHFEPEEAGLIGKWAEERGHEMVTIRLYKGDKLPVVRNDDAIVVMGGPMNVDEDGKYPWLGPEKKLIACHIENGGKVFGVCLGGQIIARSMGARVKKNGVKEIGWHAVRFHPEARKGGPFKDFPETLVALQWHGDTFDIPEGAKHAASSDVCAHQAICVGSRVIGLQFHFEAEEKEVRDFVRFFDSELAEGGPYVQGGEEIVEGLVKYAQPCKEALFTLLDRWENA